MNFIKSLSAAACAVLLLVQQSFAAQAAGAIPRLPSGKPNLNGVWEFPYVPDMGGKGNGRNQIGAGDLPFTPAGKLNMDRYDSSKGDYTGACLPFGHVRSMNSPNPVQFFQTDTDFAYLFEVNTWHHAFKIGGKSNIYDLPATWYGNSHGEWDGDTFVVTTGNYNGKTRLDTIGHPHSHKMTVTERITMKDADTLQYVITIDDPIYYSKPWSNTRTFTRLKEDIGLLEYSCEENNKGLWEGRLKVPDYKTWHTYDYKE